MKITKIRNRTAMFTVPECAEGVVNMAVILGTKHNFIIDTGIGGDCARAMLNYIGDDSKPIIVVNTHGDWDHMAGNWLFDDKVIISHTFAYDRMDKRWDEQIQRAKENDRYFEGEIHKCLPNLTFEESLHFPEDGIRLFHTPGHTDGCISIYDSVDKVLHAGDSFGALDGKAAFWGNELTDFQHLIDAYKQCDFEVCISGHCEPQPKEVIGWLETALTEAKKEKSEAV